MELEESLFNNNMDNIKAKKAIRLTIDRFIKGIRELDSELILSAFHPLANSYSMTPNGLCIEPAKAWPKIIRQAKSDKNHLFQQTFSAKILKIEIVRTVAAARVEWTFKNTKIIDFYNMLKTEREWLIVNQVYHTFRSEKPD